MLSLIAASTNGLTMGAAARGGVRAPAAQMGVGLVYSTTTGEQVLSHRCTRRLTAESADH